MYSYLITCLQQDVNIEGEELENRSDIAKIEEWVALCVEDIISQSSHASTLVVGRLVSFHRLFFSVVFY